MQHYAIHDVKDYKFSDEYCLRCSSTQVLRDSSDENYICLDCGIVFQFSTMNELSPTDWEIFKGHFLKEEQAKPEHV